MYTKKAPSFSTTKTSLIYSLIASKVSYTRFFLSNDTRLPLKTLTLFLLVLFFSLNLFADVESVNYPGGNLHIKYKYKVNRNGEKIKHGHYNEYFPSGGISLQYHYRNGVLHGKCYENYVNRQKKWSGAYKENIKSGTWLFFRESGKKKIKAYFNSQGLTEKILRYDNNGKKDRLEIFENGVLVEVKMLKRSKKKRANSITTKRAPPKIVRP